MEVNDCIGRKEISGGGVGCPTPPPEIRHMGIVPSLESRYLKH